MLETACEWICYSTQILSMNVRNSFMPKKFQKLCFSCQKILNVYMHITGNLQTLSILYLKLSFLGRRYTFVILQIMFYFLFNQNCKKFIIMPFYEQNTSFYIFQSNICSYSTRVSISNVSATAHTGSQTELYMQVFLVILFNVIRK